MKTPTIVPVTADRHADVLATLDADLQHLAATPAALLEAAGAESLARLTAVLTGRRRILARHAPSVFLRRARCGWCTSGRTPTSWPCLDWTDAAADYLTSEETHGHVH